jgi:hypothetical protein
VVAVSFAHLLPQMCGHGRAIPLHPIKNGGANGGFA